MYERAVVQSESLQVLDAEGPLDGALQWEYQRDPPHSDRWSMSVGAVSDASDLLDRESDGLEPAGGSPVSATRDDAVSSPRAGPGSPMWDVEDTGGANRD